MMSSFVKPFLSFKKEASLFAEGPALKMTTAAAFLPPRPATTFLSLSQAASSTSKAVWSPRGWSQRPSRVRSWTMSVSTSTASAKKFLKSY